VLASDAATQTDPGMPVLLALVAILAAAKLGGELFERLGMPPVLGELVGGVILGNFVLIFPTWSFFEPLRIVPILAPWASAIDVLARLGVIILLFEVGLGSTVQGMAKVGASALMVAVLGVVAPFILGFFASWLFIGKLPDELTAAASPSFSLNYIHMFVGAVLCATSVGITARVFKDLGRIQTKEAQIILGAAVIDDVLGLVILAVVSGIVRSAELGQPLQISGILHLIAISILFLGGALAVGSLLLPRLMKQLSRLRTSGVMLVSALAFAFAMSYLASAVGLAAIVGAFAAGLLLEEVHFQGFREKISIHQLISPVSTFLVPIFFVLMGIQVRLETFANPKVVGIAAGLTLAAILGKQICGLAIRDRNINRLSIGIGMIPRGEVGLIFAGIGRTLRVIDDATFSAIVIMVIVTTLSTPPLLKWVLSRRQQLAP
jgi:Kef-type K+ transport system membrane component KefB